MRVTFFMTDLNGLGGTARATLALAKGLRRRGEDVEIISVFNSPTHGDLRVPAHLPIRVIVKEAMNTGDADSPPRCPVGRDRPAQVFPRHEEHYKRFNGYVEDAIAGVLGELRTDAIVSTRTGLAAYLAHFVADDIVKVCQIHEDPRSHNDRLHREMREVYRRIDAVEVLTEYARRGLEEKEPALRGRVHVLPNAIDDSLALPYRDDTKLIVAVGRLAPIKQFDLLIEAFALLAPDFPDWRLRIFGRGPEARRLRLMVDRLGLHDRITVPGAALPSFMEWAKADIGVSSSRVESFGVSIVEAMSMGVPVVATDVPSGPGEIITSKVDGLLVEPNVTALASGLRTVMDDTGLRRSMSANAIRTAKRFTADEVARKHTKLLHRLTAETRTGGPAAIAPESPRLVVERTSPQSVEITVHGEQRAPLTLRSSTTGAQCCPTPFRTERAFDGYRIDHAALATDVRTEEWEVLTPPMTYRLDHVGAAALLDAETDSASDLLPQYSDGRLVLRARSRRRFGEVRSFRRVDRRSLKLTVTVIGAPPAEATLKLLQRGGKQPITTVPGRARPDGDIEFILFATHFERCVRSGVPELSPRIADGGSLVKVGSLCNDMAGRRVMGVFELASASIHCEWGYDRAGSMFINLRS